MEVLSEIGCEVGHTRDSQSRGRGPDLDHELPKELAQRDGWTGGGTVRVEDAVFWARDVGEQLV